MKLKHLIIIDWIWTVIIGLVMLPFCFCSLTLRNLAKPFDFVSGNLAYFYKHTSNKMLQNADEVKNGTIANKHYLKCCTVKQVYNLWVNHHKKEQVS